MVKGEYVSVRNLYGEPNTLRPFNNQERTYDFLSDKQVVELAKQVSSKITESPYKRVLISETGASPFAEVCDLILRQNQEQIDWQCMKVPRESGINIFHPLIHYLTEEERKEKLPAETVSRIKDDLQIVNKGAITEENIENMTREELLQYICQLIPEQHNQLPPLPDLLSQLPSQKQLEYQHIISHVVQGCSFPNFLKESFLYFDEYIDSGKTLQQTDFYLNFLAKNPQYKTLSYYIFISHPEEFPLIFFSLFSQDTREECNKLGAYPFENRIDLIGHFYAMSDSLFKRISLDEFPYEKPTDVNEEEGRLLLNTLITKVKEESLYEKLKEKLQYDEVKMFIQPDHLLRFLLLHLEKKSYGDTEVSQFLWQCFDMYGPCWSPLPDAYHLDYWQAFDSLATDLPEEKFEESKQLYQKCRSSILTTVLQEFTQRRNEWKERIEKILQEDMRS